MRWPLRLLLCGVVLLWLAPAAAQAQSSTAASQPPAADTAPADPGNFWFGVGGAYVVRRGDCTTCEQDFPFLNDMGLLIDVGRRINPQMDVAAEVYWTPTSSSDDRANVTHLDAIAQYRLWKSHGFFLKGGAGMALVRNWVDVTGGGDSVRSKAFSVVIGGGWHFHATERFSAQIFATQHAAALGDLQTSEGEFQDVLANFWSIGVSVAFRR